MVDHVLKAEPGHFALKNSLNPDVKLRCAKCNNIDRFIVVVRPSDNIARVTGIVCNDCKNVVLVNEGGYIMATGEIQHRFKDQILKRQ